MNRPHITLIIILAIIALGSIGYAAYDYARPDQQIVAATTTPSTPEVRAYGNVALSLGESALFDGLRITPQAIVEDSRCPADVQCIQAGTARLELEIVSGLGTSTNVIALGTTVTTEAEEVTFLGVSPERRSGQDIGDGDYRFTFLVEKRTVSVPAPAPAKCYIGGCSSQLCTDRPDAVSTCEYRESYACYTGATCERQASGECGWTETAALKACLLGAR